MYYYDKHTTNYTLQAVFSTISGDLYVNYWFSDTPYFCPSRGATVKLAAWAKRLHGNAPAGAYYGSFTAILPDGTRKAIRIYL